MATPEGSIVVATYYECGHSEIIEIVHGVNCPRGRPQDHREACPSINGTILFRSYHRECTRCMLISRDSITWQEATDDINLDDGPSIAHELDLQQIVPESIGAVAHRLQQSTALINDAYARLADQEQMQLEERVLTLPEEAGCTAVTSSVQERCIICRDLEEPATGYNENDQPVITPCGPPGHEIGRRCLTLWLDQGLRLEGCGRCPVCRKILIDRRATTN